MSVPSLPAPLRWLNALGSAAARARLVADALDADQVCAEACKKTGLADFGEPYFRAPLAALIASVNRDANLHFLGRRHLHDLIVRSLITRLRLAPMAKEADSHTLRAPLLVCGLPRSGTTFLHRLLALADEARPLLLWELMDPLPGAGKDRRLQSTQRRLSRLRHFAPASIDAQHLMRAELPDECGHLFKATFLSSLYALAPVTGYLAWYPHQDMRGAYRDYRRLLVLLADPARRLVLKDPFHALHLPALFAAIPNALVVQTHRAPAEVLPSFHKLTLTLQSVLAKKIDVEKLVATNSAWLGTLADRSVSDRALLPAGQVCDVDYRALVADPVAVVRTLHERFALPWPSALEARLTAFVRDNGQRKHGDNPYTAAAFGQSEAEIDERFAAYRARFL